jgi:putative endonuclease
MTAERAGANVNPGEASHPERSEGSRGFVGSNRMFVYILASRTRCLYVGVTNDLVRRVYEHREGLLPGFTKRYGVRRLVYFEAFGDPEAAIRREKQIKGYARAKNLALVSSSNPEWHDLAEQWFANASPPDPSLRSG